MTFDGNDLYPTLVEKAAALGYSIIQNHPFIDGNKRAGHAALEVFLKPKRSGNRSPATFDSKFSTMFIVSSAAI
jgi:death-on-curing protein